MYLEYVLNFAQAKPGELTASNARHALSIALKHSNLRLPLEIFSRESDGCERQVLYPSDEGMGRSYVAPPLVAISGMASGLRVVGVGPQGVELVEAHIAQMAGALGAALNSVYSIQRYSGKCSVAPSAPRLYTAHSLVVEKNTKHLKPILEQCEKDAAGRHVVEFELLAPKIGQAIRNALLGQALYLNDAQAGLECDYLNIPSDDMLGIRVLEGKPFFFRVGEKGWGLGVDNLIFSADVKLDGRWSAGKLRSKGYGAIRPYYAAAERVKGDQG